jgi:cytochrome b561
LVRCSARCWCGGCGGARPAVCGCRQPLDKTARLAHGVLYLLLIVTVLLGVANAWVRGDTLFGLFKIPAFDPGNTELRESVEDWHGLSANILLALAGLHAAAALLHHYVFKDDVLRRMLPR